MIAKCRYCGRRHEKIAHDKTIILGYADGIPIVEAKADVETGFLSFYCQWCRKEHLHGRSEGHRSAHCVNRDSPLYERGYILKEVV